MNYFFWFFLFLSIPIIVHLFNFRRAKKLLFTNVKFIRKVSTETKSKTRLKHFLILGARILSFLFLIAAFVLSLVNLKSNELSKIDSMGLFYLDNSNSSIGNSINDERAFIEELVGSKKANSGFFLTNNFSSFSNNERTKAEILQQVEDLTVSYTSRSVPEVLDRVDKQSDTYLISDFQDSSVDQLEMLKNDSSNNYYLIYKEYAQLKNAFIDSVWIERDLEEYSNLLLNCRVGHTENFVEGSIVVKLIDVGGNQISSVVVDLSSELEVEFSLPQNFSTSLFQIQINGDEIEYDNEFYITLNKNRAPSVLILSQSSNRYLESIFGNSSLFDLTISNGEIDYELLKSVDLVILNDYYELPAGLINQNSNEATFFLIPSDSIDLTNFRLETGFSLERSQSPGSFEIQLPKGNELMKGVYKKIDEGTAFPRARRKYQITGAHEAILLLRNGGTFLAKSIGSSIYLLTSPLSDEYTDFPNHSIFLPIMYRIADESLETDNTLFVYPNDFLEVSSLSPDLPPKIVSEKIELIPEFSLTNQGGLVKIPNDLAPGFYHVKQGNDTIKSFGLNLPKKESLYNGPSLAEISDFFSDSPHVSVVPVSDQRNSSILELSDNNRLWKYALILALIFLTLETVFHRYLK